MKKEDLIKKYEVTGERCPSCNAKFRAVPPFDGICPNCDDYKDM